MEESYGMIYREKSLDRVLYYSGMLLGWIFVVLSIFSSGIYGLIFVALTGIAGVFILFHSCERCGDGFFFSKDLIAKRGLRYLLRGAPLLIPSSCPHCGLARW